MSALPYAPLFERIEDGYRHRPAQYISEPGIPRGWYQDGRKLRRVKASKAFIWPKDGKYGTTWGRVKDVFTNKGPDIFVAFGANKGDCVSNRPTRAQWSGHTNLDDRGKNTSFNCAKFAPWTTNGMLGGRMPGLSYDFRTREHHVPYSHMWSDAIWQQEPYKNEKWNLYPEAVRTMDGRWWQDYQYVPQFLSGPVNNKLGQGMFGVHFPRGA